MKIKLLLIIFTCILYSACTAPIELDTNDSDPVIVIYGYINEELTHQSIKISSSSPYFDTEQNEPVSDATVTIVSSEDEIFILEEVGTEKGTYKTIVPMAGIAGLKYHLKVDVDFDKDGLIETYEAETTMPRLFELDSIRIEAVSIMGYKHYSLNMYVKEDLGEDYYLCRMVVNDTIERLKLSQYLVFSDRGFDGDYVDGLTLSYINDIEDYDEDEDDDDLYVKPGDHIKLLSSRIEKGYYHFVEQCQSEKWGENPFFGGPASNITTNITNGGVGYFTSFYTSELEENVPYP